MSARDLPGSPSPEHEFEAERGLPEALPHDERLLWQGSPEWRVLAREALHTRGLALYFTVLLVWRGATVLEGNGSSGGSLADAGLAVLWLAPLALAAIGVLSLMAWLIARTSVYTLTDKRVVMRIGVVLNITFNLPYSQIESAALRRNADGSGDLTLTLAESDRIAYFHLWPHARPWHVKRTQPMLRAVPAVDAVAALLASSLAAASATSLATSSAFSPAFSPAVCLPEPVPSSLGSAPAAPLAVPLPRPSANDGRQPLAA